MVETPSSGDAGRITRVFRGIRHARQSRQHFEFSLVIEKLSIRVPTAKRVSIEWIRGPNRVRSEETRTLHRGAWECRWDLPLILNATMFFSQKTDTVKRHYAPKMSRIRFLNSAKREECLGEVSVDLATIIDAEPQNLVLVLPLRRSPDPHAWVKLSVKYQKTEEMGGDLVSDMSSYSKRSSEHPSDKTDELRKKSRRRSLVIRQELPSAVGDNHPAGSETGTPVRDCSQPEMLTTPTSKNHSRPPLTGSARHPLCERLNRLRMYDSSANLPTPLGDDEAGTHKESVPGAAAEATVVETSLAKVVDEVVCDDVNKAGPAPRWDQYVSVSKLELVAKLQRLESRLKSSVSDEPSFLVELEEELISTKVRLAQAESEKDELREAANLRICELNATLEDYVRLLTDLEGQLTRMKMQQRTRRGSRDSASSRFKQLMKGRIALTNRKCKIHFGGALVKKSRTRKPSTSPVVSGVQ